VHVHHDERSAAFMALGSGLATGRPAIVLTTSGTATVNLHPAVVEADLSGVPMIVCTADRPPWLQNRGAPQTIDQKNLYGTAVRAFHDPGVPDAADATRWRLLARQVLSEAVGASDRPGPVQLNLAFDEPLTAAAGELPPLLDDVDPDEPADRPPQPERLVGRGVIVAGRSHLDRADIVRLATEAGWPILADPRSGLDRSARRVVCHADSALRHPATAERLRPDVVLRVGEAPASRVVNEWLRDSGAHEVVVADRHLDPWVSADDVVVTSRPDALAAWSFPAASEASWVDGWVECDGRARDAIGSVIAVEALTEPGVAHAVLHEAPAGSAIVLSSSMPVRDAEWFGGQTKSGVDVYSNRGANGIDGVTSTAAGIALAGRRVVAVIGDVAFLHDTNGLLGLAARDVDLTLVVIDNDGGGIFSFLPQARDLSEERFEQLFGTPHGVDLQALARAHGLPCHSVASRAGLTGALGSDGTQIVLVHTDRQANVELHEAINTAVAAALGHGS
jgi:2-succinyl-5-enolpyruvyl-6-hydroxy-3-cyclohexene-1-carboxylate synthase